jgi:hypothetical protein
MDMAAIAANRGDGHQSMLAKCGRPFIYGYPGLYHATAGCARRLAMASWRTRLGSPVLALVGWPSGTGRIWAAALRSLGVGVDWLVLIVAGTLLGVAFSPASPMPGHRADRIVPGSACDR